MGIAPFCPQLSFAIHDHGNHSCKVEEEVNFDFKFEPYSCHFKNQEKSIVEEWNSLTNLGLNSGPFQN